MMRGITPTLEKHHKVAVLDEAVEDAVKLSHRYITDRQLPDKAVSLLDTACARVALSQSATPPVVEDCRREIDHLQAEINALRTRGGDRRRPRRPPGGVDRSEGQGGGAQGRAGEAAGRGAQAGGAGDEAAFRAAEPQGRRRFGRRQARRAAGDGGRGRHGQGAAALAGAAVQGPGQDAAGPPRRGPPGRGRGRLRLDRHPGRQDGAATRSRPC